MLKDIGFKDAGICNCGDDHLPACMGSGFIHADYPGCVVRLRLGSLYVSSLSIRDATNCSVFITRHIENVIMKRCAREIDLLQSVGYAIVPICFITNYPANQVLLHTQNGPNIYLDYDFFTEHIEYIVGFDRIDTFNDIWRHLPPIYTDHLALLRRAAQLESMLHEIYAPGGIGAMAAKESFENLQ